MSLNFLAPLQAQTSSVLSSGNWFKFSVTQEGIYKITYDQLKTIGMNPDQLDPKKIKLFSGENGMLPQPNSEPRIKDLKEISIQVVGEEDGKFNSTDYILFYGLGPDKFNYQESHRIFWYENNLFTDKNFYFLTYGNSNGKRIATQENIAGTFPIVDSFNDFAYYETEKYNLLKSGRQWFGEQFDGTTDATIRFNIPGIVPNSEIMFTSHVMAQSISNCSFKVLFNNQPILDQPIGPIPNTSYTEKGIIKADTVALNSSNLNAPTQSAQEIKFQFVKGSSGLSIGYLDFFLFNTKRKLALYDDQTFFSSSESTQQGVSTFQINTSASDAVIWEVTDAFNAGAQTFNVESGLFKFSTATNSLKRFCVFIPSKTKSASFESTISNQNLHGLVAPQLLIVANKLLKTEAMRLAAHRNSHDQLSVAVVTPEEIYNEYSSGKQDFTAIRDFIRDLFEQQNSSLKNVLLFGRGSYDYKNRILSNTNFIPIYESRNSLSPLETYSSDDYYGFLEKSEGEWREFPAQDHTLDIGIGRIPAKTSAEAKVVVDKLIEYDLGKNRFDEWRKSFLFVADDGDFNIHQGQADQLASSIEFSHPEINTTRFLLDNYTQLERASGQYSPDAYKALNVALKKGAVVVNYTGHGSEEQWMQERVLDSDLIKNFRNAPYYPLFVTATCEFGRNDDPIQISSGEKTILQKGGGSIGIVTTARPVQSSTNFILNEAFYNALFTKSNGAYRSLGSVFRDTKNNSSIGVGNRNFSLLGDPSMTLALGEHQIEITEAKTSSGSDILKGLSKVTVKGNVLQNGVTASGFSGDLFVSLFNKPGNYQTRGDESAPFSYSERDDLLFHGQSSIQNGSFQFDFIMPQGVNNSSGYGKFSLYARSTNEDASGFYLNSLVGGIELNPPADVTGPQVQLFLGDTTFVDGGTVGPDSELIVKLSDDHGINSSSANPSALLAGRLDDSQSFPLSNYFLADKNTYQKGIVRYPLIGLEKGNHQINVTASDSYGNNTTSSLRFNVIEGDHLFIEQFGNYPNPFSDNTSLVFTQSRPGEDLEADLSIYNLAGQVVLNQQFSIPYSQYKVTLTEWDGTQNGTKLYRGIYLAKLSVRSLSDGSKNEKIAKLILLN